VPGRLHVPGTGRQSVVHKPYEAAPSLRDIVVEDLYQPVDVEKGRRVGDRARGVQFHPEVRHEQAMAWFGAESRELPRPLAQIERELTDKLPAWQELGRALCRAFLRSASG